MAELKRSFIVAVLLIHALLLKAQGKASYGAIDSLQLLQKQIIGTELPAFSIRTDTGLISNAILNGKVALINIWANGCLPCMAEIPALNDIYDSLKNNGDFIFISFSPGKREQLTEVALRNHIKYPVELLSMDSCNVLIHGIGFPVTYVISKKGKIIYCKVGGQQQQDKAYKDVMKQVYPVLCNELSK